MTAKTPLPDDARCPCLSGLTYGECCGPLHRGERVAPTALALMRSRYSAFAVHDGEYLSATWHPRSRPDVIGLDTRERWYRLDIEETVGGGPLDSQGVVEFTAYHRSDDERGSLHERSGFVREQGRWWYVGRVQRG